MACISCSVLEEQLHTKDALVPSPPDSSTSTIMDAFSDSRAASHVRLLLGKGCHA